MAIAFAVLIFMYATTFKTAETLTFVSAVLLLVIGLMFAWVMVGVKFEPFDFASLGESLIWTALCVGVIYMVNKEVPFRLDVQLPISLRLFSVLMGVAEECFFRLWLCGFINKSTLSSVLAIFVSSLVWTIYHIARYQGQAGAFWVIFFAGLVLGGALVYSKRADGVIFAHAFVNFLATA